MINLIRQWIEARRQERAALQWSRLRYATRADFAYWARCFDNEDRRAGR